MLDWMKQQDPNFFSNISIVSDPTGKLPTSVVDDASRDTSGMVSGFQSHPTSGVVLVASMGLPSVEKKIKLNYKNSSSRVPDSTCTSPVTPVPMSEGSLCFSGCNPTPKSSKVVESLPWKANRNGYEQLDTIKKSFPVYESTIHLLTFSDPKPEGGNLGPTKSSTTAATYEHRPGVLPIRTLAECKGSFTKITAPLNDGWEEVYLGQHNNGLKNENWAAIDSWGSQLLTRKIDWVLTSKQNISPLVINATDQRLVNWNENNHVYPNQLPSPSPMPAMAYVFQRDRRVRSSSRTEWKERKKKDLSFHGGSQVGLSHKCHKYKEGCDHYTWDANQASVDQLSKKVSVESCQILEFFRVVSNYQSGLSDNHLVFVTELCVQLNIRLGSCSIEVKSLVAKYGNTRLEWLTFFGKVNHNWDMYWTQFVYNDVTVHLQGLGTPQCSLASRHSVFSLRDKSSLDGPSLCDLLFFVWEVNCHHIQKLHSWFKSIIGAGLWFSFIFNQGIGMSSVENVCGRTPPPMGMQDVPGRVRVEEVMKERHEWDDFWKRNVHFGSSFLPPDLKTKAAYGVIPMVFFVTCTIENRLDQVHKWLIHWKGQPDGKATREVELNLNIMRQFPEASLEDKTCFEGVGNDTDTNMVIKRENEPKLLHA
ncbi:unnamed protein product [Lactuca saligna]|uniref:Uncharacterized protein n=1 Tax=Lactuca saligna TaxID=75948 RepID=A0AA35YDR5_LACSI|nr:unnamed protein product [Lactuca saligna]